MVQTLTSLEEFENVIDSGKTVVVDFTATWCGPCRKVAQPFERLANIYTELVFVKVDVDEAHDVATRYNVTCMPTFHVFQNKTIVDSMSGSDIQKLNKMVEAYGESKNLEC